MNWRSLAILLVAPTMTPAQVSLNWHTIDGGGGASGGGAYALNGSIGQSGAGPLAGGSYSIAGGFWGGLAVQTPGAPLLSVTLSNASVIVYWPRPAIGFVLDQAVAPAGAPGSWTPVTLPYGTNATHIYFTTPAAGSKFYRLRRP